MGDEQTTLPVDVPEAPKPGAGFYSLNDLTVADVQPPPDTVDVAAPAEVPVPVPALGDAVAETESTPVQVDEAVEPPPVSDPIQERLKAQDTQIAELLGAVKTLLERQQAPSPPPTPAPTSLPEPTPQGKPWEQDRAREYAALHLGVDVPDNLAREFTEAMALRQSYQVYLHDPKQAETAKKYIAAVDSKLESIQHEAKREARIADLERRLEQQSAPKPDELIGQYKEQLTADLLDAAGYNALAVAHRAGTLQLEPILRSIDLRGDFQQVGTRLDPYLATLDATLAVAQKAAAPTPAPDAPAAAATPSSPGQLLPPPNTQAEAVPVPPFRKLEDLNSEITRALKARGA